MFIYYSSVNYSAKQSGIRLVGVICDQCGCEYCYELKREGSGLAGASYGIRKERAEVRSHELAAADLKKRLEREGDLVPCPKCGWLNEEMVEGYRRTRYQGMLRRSGLFAAFGIPLSLVVAWFIWIGPQTDHGVLPYVLIWIPLFFIVLVAVMYPLQLWLRGRIQPNRNFPAAPEIPADSPPAMYFNKAKGTLTPAKPEG